VVCQVSGGCHIMRHIGTSIECIIRTAALQSTKWNRRRLRISETRNRWTWNGKIMLMLRWWCLFQLSYSIAIPDGYWCKDRQRKSWWHWRRCVQHRYDYRRWIICRDIGQCILRFRTHITGCCSRDIHYGLVVRCLKPIKHSFEYITILLFASLQPKNHIKIYL
jgi:hypothetical protein